MKLFTQGAILTTLLASGLVFADAMTIINNDVGVGTETPEGALHIYRDSGIKPAVVIESVGGTVPSKWEIKSNPATGRLTFKDLNGSTTPFKFAPTAAENLFRVGILADDTVDINGKLVISGDCTEQDGACADYVFEPGYELRSLDTLEQFIQENQHLPNVPSASEIKQNGVNMTHFTGRLLEKIEELTLYTLQQQQTITGLQSLIAEQGKRLEELEQSR